jgi:hypothetical protein
MILDAKEVLPKILDAYDNGWGKVYDLGFKSLSPFYNIVEGSCTDWTGYAGSGKTELLLDCVKNCCEWYGHKYLIHMPDAGTPIEVLTHLMHKISGKQFDEFYIDKFGEKREIINRLSKSEVMNLTPMVLDMFKIFVPSEAGSKSVTPLEFWKYAVDNKSKLGLFGAVIDSWNYMSHDTKGFSREDKWLEHVLSSRNMMAENSGMHFHTIIHPTSEKKDKDGKRMMPDKYSLKGGSEWANNGKSMIIVDRPFGSTITDVKIEKAKPKRVGHEGIVALQFDVAVGSFYEVVGSGEKRFPSLKTQSKIEPNNDFNTAPF